MWSSARDWVGNGTCSSSVIDLTRKKIAAVRPASESLLGTVIASEAKQSRLPYRNNLDCFVAYAPVRKRVAFVAGNDGK
jgi:hypothetical protein